MLRFVAAILLGIGACGGGGGDGGGRPVVIPTVAAGDYETGCADLCTLAAGDSSCTAKHAEFCVARCRVVTRDLPQACAACLIAAGTHIEGYTSTSGDRYCTVGGPAELDACDSECDDAGAAPASSEMETLCQLTCAFYMQDPTPLACSADASVDCLTECRATASVKGRVCAQCTIEKIIPGRVCINDDCDCANTWPLTSVCESMCDALPP